MENIFYAHSGGVTSVLNTIAANVIIEARKAGMGQVLIGKNGILGAIENKLYATAGLDQNQLQQIAKTPASVFGSCRYKLGNNPGEFEKIFDTFAKHEIKHVIYNGGNDSQDTTLKLWQASKDIGYPLQCIGLPKTIDNDLMGMDCCPGFGSAAKYIAISTLEAALDVKSMSETSTKVFILEVMGRHAGWLAAASALAKSENQLAPHIILMPEVLFDRNKFIQEVDKSVKINGFCVIVASEGIQDTNDFVAAASSTDAFGHQQLGGVAQTLANYIKQDLGYKLHYAIADYLQRSAGHIRSKCDVDHAVALAKHSVNALARGESGKVFAIERMNSDQYKWQVIANPIDIVANQERCLPKDFIAENGMHVTEACIDYMRPWILDEDTPSYAYGIPSYFIDDIPLIGK